MTQRSLRAAVIAAAALAMAACGDDSGTSTPPPDGGGGGGDGSTAPDTGPRDATPDAMPDDDAGPMGADATPPPAGGACDATGTTLDIAYDGMDIPIDRVDTSANPIQVALSATTSWGQATTVVLSWLDADRAAGTFALPGERFGVSLGAPDAGRFFTQVATENVQGGVSNVEAGTVEGSVSLVEPGTNVGERVVGCVELTMRWTDADSASHAITVRGTFDGDVVELPQPGGG